MVNKYNQLNGELDKLNNTVNLKDKEIDNLKG